MGFWDDLARLIQRQPKLEVVGGGGQIEEQLLSGVESLNLNADQAGNNATPGVRIEHCKSRINRLEMEVIVWMTSLLAVEIELKKIVFLGRTTAFDRMFFKPNEGREIRLYRGGIPTSDHHHIARLYYKERNNGIYFRADFAVGYSFNPKGFYEVEEFRPIYPVRRV